KVETPGGVLCQVLVMHIGIGLLGVKEHVNLLLHGSLLTGGDTRGRRPRGGLCTASWLAHAARHGVRDVATSVPRLRRPARRDRHIRGTREGAWPAAVLNMREARPWLFSIRSS